MRRPFCSLECSISVFAKKALIALYVALFFSPSVYAAFIQYDDEASFTTALSGLTVTTADFESVAAGTVIASGDTVEGITFTHALPVNITVDNVFDTTSPFNYLATDDVTPAFIGGDEFTMSFASAVMGFGLYVHTDSFFFDDDIVLTTDTGGVASLLALPDISLFDGEAYFIGLVTDSSAEAFSSVTLSSALGDYFFNVDDITTAVRASDPNDPTPVNSPGTLALLLLGLAGMLGRKSVIQKGSMK